MRLPISAAMLSPPTCALDAPIEPPTAAPATAAEPTAELELRLSPAEIEMLPAAVVPLF